MKKLITLIISAMLVLFLLFGYSTSVNSDLSQSIVRLHILANSDSKEDQELKFKVRDKILEHSKSQATRKADVPELLDTYKHIAENVIKESGYSYSVDVEYGNFSFPTRDYDSFRLPAGNYDAVRIKIGNAEGKNWWCVLFPPLCFVDGTTDEAYAEDMLRASINGESYDLISSQSGDSPFSIKFKIVEFYGKLRGRDKVYAHSK